MSWPWTAWFSRKASDVARAVYLVSASEAAWRPANYETFAKEGYGANITVYACVNEIARSVGGLQWCLYRKATTKRGKAHQKIEMHPLLDLLRHPNAMQGGGSFFEQLVGYLMISGNNYINLVSLNTGPPRELWNLRPDRMSLTLSRTETEVAAYRYEVGGMLTDIDASRVLHVKLFNPTNDFYGLSPLQVAARTVDTDAEAIKWNKALLQNSARPSGALWTEQPLTDQQFTRLKTEVSEKYQGALNTGRPLLLEGGLKWQSISLNPAELDWLNGRKMTMRELCQVFQVPPEMIGDGESKTYANYQEARKSFYQETVLPLACRLCDDFNTALVPHFGEGLYLDIDRDQIDALAEERTAVWERTTKADWLTINEKRALTGYDPIEGGDVLLVSASLLPLGAALTEPMRLLEEGTDAQP